ncbi:hypothetical protein OPT61_g7394 [Boeremia exigua]|uniref:Uncharacterized protein n=1 Tax=Boeremia exigua TaxID=749465 RepID=A0ACC2I3E9_9PLEO|nr:hypothetical protein OPT61_g7394 [Boeremia exigua]
MSLCMILLLMALAYPVFINPKATPSVCVLDFNYSLKLTDSMQKISEQASCRQGDVLSPVKTDALDPKERPCCICLQPFGSAGLDQSGSEAPIQLPCGHIFGEVCISSWTLAHDSCPLCRQQVFGFSIGGHAVNQDTDLQVSTLFSSLLSPDEDFWLYDDVWTDADSRQDTVSSVDIETFIYDYANDHSEVDLGYQPQRSPKILSCGEHRGFCYCGDDQNTRNAALPNDRPMTPANAQSAQMGIDDFDLAGLGLQFEELEYRYKVWMDEFLNEPSFGGMTWLNEGFFADTRVGETVRHDRQ